MLKINLSFALLQQPSLISVSVEFVSVQPTVHRHYLSSKCLCMWTYRIFSAYTSAFKSQIM